ERTHLLSIDRDNSHNFIVLKHRYTDQSAALSDLNRRNPHLHPVGRCLAYVLDLHHVTSLGNLAHRTPPIRCNERLRKELVMIFLRTSQIRNDAELVAFAKPEISKPRFANTQSVRQHRIEDWF